MLRKICGTLRMRSLMSHIFVNQRIVGNTDTKGTIIGNLKASPLPKKKVLTKVVPFRVIKLEERKKAGRKKRVYCLLLPKLITFARS